MKITNIIVANCTTIYRWKMFCMIISKDELCFFSCEIEFLLYIMVTEPIISHIPLFGSLLGYFIFGKFSVVLLLRMIGVGGCGCPSCCST